MRTAGHVGRHWGLTLTMALLCATAAARGVAEGIEHRVLPAGTLTQDPRLTEQQNLDGYFPFAPPATLADWEARAAKVRQQMLVAMGLWPMPEPVTSQPVIHGRIERPDYTIDKVYFESFPGFFVTGNLYRPVGRTGPLAAVLCPHGHYALGRFADAGEDEIRKDLVVGAERFANGGRSPLQSRCVQLARMGCVVFHYDMVGYADSRQLAHRAGVRPLMNTDTNWGYFSPQAELRLQTIMGLQTYNSIRALDFLMAQPDVDPKRVAVSGSSGGGTQTFILCALDPRPQLAFPAVMVSTAMQGGCTCENACYLRVETGNVEFAALFAPKPLGMTAADDWTREIMTKGLPELKQLWGLYGQPDNVMARALLHFPHNFNYPSRAIMYSWLNKHFDLGLEEPVVEEDYPRLSGEELSVWDAEHPAPPSGDEFERSFLAAMTIAQERQWSKLMPTDSETLAKYREHVGTAAEVMLGGGMPPAGEVTHELVAEIEREGHREFHMVLGRASRRQRLPVIFLHPAKWNHRVVVWLDEQGKAGLFDAQGQPSEATASLLAKGYSVVGIDLLGQGEFLADPTQPLTETKLVGSPVKKLNGYAGYTFGYNWPLCSSRVQDVLLLLSFIRNHPHHEHADYNVESIDLCGLAGSGVYAVAARALAGDAIRRTAVDTAGFRFTDVKHLEDPNFLPGAAKYGDLPGLIALAAPHPLWLAGETDVPTEVILSSYQAAGAVEQLVLCTEDVTDRVTDALDWLTGP